MAKLGLEQNYVCLEWYIIIPYAKKKKNTKVGKDSLGLLFSLSGGSITGQLLHLAIEKLKQFLRKKSAVSKS